MAFLPRIALGAVKDQLNDSILALKLDLHPNIQVN